MNQDPAHVVTKDGAPLWTHAGPRTEPTPWVWLALLTAFALALRAFGANQGLWWDEIRTLVDSVRSPLSDIVTVFPGDNQHTFFSVLARLSITVFGEHPWSLRLPAILLGAATVPVLYLFAREFVGRVEALLAGLLLTVAYHHVWFSQSARGYSALALLTLLSSWLLLRGLRRGRAGDFVGYGIVAALGIYTHLTMIFLVASHALLCLIPLGLPRSTTWRRWRLPALGFLLAGAGTLLLYSPVLLDVRQFVVSEPSPMEGATPKWAALELLRGLNIGLGGLFGVLVGTVLFTWGLWSYFKQSRFVVGMFLLPGVVTLAAAVALHRPVRPRFVFFLIGFALLIVVRGALEAGKWATQGQTSRLAGVPALGIALVAVMAVLSSWSVMLASSRPKQDFEGAMRFVEMQRQAGEPVVTAGGARYPYREYYLRAWKPIGSLQELESARAQGRRVWVIYTLESYIKSHAPNLMGALRSECAVAGVFRGTLGGGNVTVCATPPVSASNTRVQRPGT